MRQAVDSFPRLSLNPAGSILRCMGKARGIKFVTGMEEWVDEATKITSVHSTQ